MLHELGQLITQIGWLAIQLARQARQAAWRIHGPQQHAEKHLVPAQRTRATAASATVPALEFPKESCRLV